MDLLNCSFKELRNAVCTKKIKAAEVAESFLARATTLNKKLNAFITLNEKCVDEAKKVDQLIEKKQEPGLMAGIPVGVKDLLCTKGLRTTAGSKILGNFAPPYSSTVVERLSAAGAIMVGKTNLDEFAMGSSNETSAFGNVKNPWDVTLVPGGSSGGSAASVSAKMVLGSIGTDTGGSIRQPASFCGIAGIKPTYGRVSRYGIVAFASSLDQAGTMANSVEDCALMLEVISGHDARDATSSKRAVPAWSKDLKDDLKGMVVGRPLEYFGHGLDPEIEKTVASAIEILKSRGATVKDVSIPSTKYAISVYYLIATSEASSNLARYDGIRYGMRAESSDLDQLYKKTRGQGFGPEVKRRIMLGTFALSSGYYDAFYIKACRARRLIQNDFLKALDQCDILVSPVTSQPPFKIGGQINDPLAMYLNDIHTTSTNLAGLPGMSVPAGFTKSGLPIGVQITARHFEEQKIFNAALAIEKATEKRRPGVF